MEKDVVDEILDQWSDERPELDTSSLGIVVRVMSLYRSYLAQARLALEPLGLEPFEYDVLAALRRQGRPFELAASVLAAETELSTGAMTNRIDKLQSRGFVKRRQDAQDRRGVNVSLTAAGRRAIDAAIQHRLDAADDSLSGLSVPERRQLAKLLRKAVLASTADN